MLIQISRALLFVNMTRSGSYFDQLCEHNINQARDRLIEWQTSGWQLRGRNEWASFAIDWDDIDYIHVISVVDGPHAACADHDLISANMPEKVKLCTTLTSSVMRNLALLGGGARDLIALCKAIRVRGKTSESRAIKLVGSRYRTLAYQAKSSIKLQPSLGGNTIIAGREVSAFEEHKLKFEMMRRQPENPELEIFSELAWTDYLPAIAFIVQSRAEMEQLREGQLRMAIFGQNVKFQVVLSNNMKLLVDNIPGLNEAADREQSAFSYLIAFGVSEAFVVTTRIATSATVADLTSP